MAISKRLRFEVLRRDNHACRYCGRSAPEVKLTIDHVVPETLGGSDDPGNLVAACADCNGGKSSVPADAPLIGDVASDALRWSRAMQRAADERAVERGRAKALHDAFTEEWNAWKDWRGDTTPRPESWSATIDQVLRAGLAMDDLIELVAVAMEARAKDTWRYFCGCCWRRIEKLQERAAELVRNVDADESAGPREEPKPGTKWFYTVWSAEEIDAEIASAEDTARRWLTQESIDSVHCPHREWGQGDCGDPLCIVRRAESLGWMSYDNMLKSDRQDAIMAAAEAAMDG